jgi:hypothetical protein
VPAATLARGGFVFCRAGGDPSADVLADPGRGGVSDDLGEFAAGTPERNLAPAPVTRE